MSAPAAPSGARVGAGNALWQLSRPRTCLVGVLAFAFGVEVTGGPWGWGTASGAVAMFLVPVVANLHNSYTDLAEDARNLPGRLLLVKSIGVARLRATVYLGLALIVVLCAVMGWAPLFIAVVGVLLLMSYSAPPMRAKARPIAGLVVFSMVVSVPFLIGIVVGDDWWSARSPLTGAGMGWFGFVTALFLAKGCVKNVPDYRGDREVGVRTSASVMPGIRSAAVVAVVVTWVVYLSYPLVVAATGASSRLYLACPWGLFALWHVTRLLRSEEPGVLNAVLKWDMCVSVVFLAHLAILPRLSVAAVVAAALCLMVLLLSDLIGADSRASGHLPQRMRRRGRGES